MLTIVTAKDLSNNALICCKLSILAMNEKDSITQTKYWEDYRNACNIYNTLLGVYYSQRNQTIANTV